MSETYQLVSGGDPEVTLYDGIAFYESGEIYKALSCWRDLLRQVPDHEVAQHYIQFVQGYLGVNDQAGEREVGAAQRREANKLRGTTTDNSAPRTQTQYADEGAPPPESLRPRRGTQSGEAPATALGVIQVESPVASQEAAVKTDEEQLPMTMVAQSSVEELARSSSAQKAIQGPRGPRSQADGLTVKALSRQLASLHRSGKYEEAVDTAKQLLSQDPQHAVARRYIDEYHRQKRAALQQKRPRSEASQGSTVSLVGSAESKPVVASSSTSASADSAQSMSDFPVSAGSVSVVDDSEAPTAAPLTARPPKPTPAELIPDLNVKPQVKLNPDQISWQEFDHRAGFFTGEVDGNTSYEDLIMISGMPRDQALTILAQLVESGVIG